MKPDRARSEGPAAADTALCVICQRRSQSESYRPFCSKRCADVDLHRWLGGVYAIPAEPDAEEDGTPSQDDDVASSN